MENLCVSEGRVSGRCLRTGLAASFLAPAPAAPFTVSGCAALDPSRYTANALRPSFHPMMYASIISSTVVSAGLLKVLEMAPEINCWADATLFTCPCHEIARTPPAGLIAQ